MSDQFIVFGMFVFFGVVVAGAVLAQFYKPSPKVENQYVCTECLTVGKQARVVPGNGWYQALLFGFGILPGIIYSIWRSSTAKHVCPECRHATMIPIDTPRGKMLMVEVERVIR